MVPRPKPGGSGERGGTVHATGRTRGRGRLDVFVIEMTDGTTEFNTAYRADAGFFYDLVKVSV